MSGDGNLERTIIYRLRLDDNIKKTAQEGKQAQEELDQTIKKTNTTFSQQGLALIYNITVLSAMREGINGIVNELYILGLTSDETHKKLMKYAAGVALFIDLARTTKGVIGLVEILKGVTTQLAVVETYRKGLINPAATALAVGALVGGGLGVAGYMGYKAGQTSVNQNITFKSGAPEGVGERSARRTALESMGG